MVAWFEWLLKSDIGTILQHRPTAFALVLIPSVFLAVIIIPFSFLPKSFNYFLVYMSSIWFPIFIFYIYVVLKSPIKILLASIPGLVLGHFFVGIAAYFAGGLHDFATHIEVLLVFPFGFVFGAAPVVLILLIWYLWKTEDLWLKAIGIPLLLISLSPYIILGLFSFIKRFFL